MRKLLALAWILTWPITAVMTYYAFNRTLVAERQWSENVTGPVDCFTIIIALSAWVAVTFLLLHEPKKE